MRCGWLVWFLLLSFAPVAHAQVYLKAHEVVQVLNVYVSSPNETKPVDIKAGLLSADSVKYQLLLGGCLFDLVEDPTDLTLKGLSRAATSFSREVTLAGRIENGVRVDIAQRRPLSCESTAYRAAIVLISKENGSGGDSMSVSVLQLGGRSVTQFQDFALSGPDPDFPEEGGLLFNYLPNTSNNDEELLFVLDVTDRADSDEDLNERDAEVIDALVEAGIELAVKMILGTL